MINIISKDTAPKASDMINDVDEPEINQIMSHCSTKQELNNALVKKFGSQKAGLIYKKNKNVFKNK